LVYIILDIGNLNLDIETFGLNNKIFAKIIYFTNILLFLCSRSNEIIKLF